MVFQRMCYHTSEQHFINDLPLTGFCTEWSGINALLYYGPTLLLSVGLKGDTITLLVAGGVGIVQALAVIPVILLIDRLGELTPENAGIIRSHMTVCRTQAAITL